jgi:D-alanyl-D-alanine carboxypeptidase (penicillin-binding protein 5/6)
VLNRRSVLAQALLAGTALASAEASAQQPARPPQRPAAQPARPPARAARPPAPTGSPATTPLGPLDTTAKFAIIIDHVTGAVLLEKEPDASMVPSSMTKLMTAYIVYEMLRGGRLKLDQELPVSERAWRMGGSKMFVQVGTSVKVEDLIRGVIVQSGNDACIVLAEGIAGSEEQFAELMNAKARDLGLERTTFRNSTGWPHPEHRSSARDIATLARRIIRDFPEYYHYDAEKSFRYNGIEQQNRNPLLQKNLADGLKTGHTDEAGYGLVASADRNGRRVIVMVNGLETMRARAEESERLLEWSFREFENVTLFTAGDVVEQAPVHLGTAPTVPLVGGRDVVMTMPRGWRNRAKVTLSYSTPVPAPVQRGTKLGTLAVSGQGVPELEVPLLAGADVPRLGLPGRAIAVVSRFLTGG